MLGLSPMSHEVGLLGPGKIGSEWVLAVPP